MAQLPAEIWEKIIEFAYNPAKCGWHKNLFKIAFVSKMHNDLIRYLFKKFIEKPIIMFATNTLLKNDIVRYMVRNGSVIEKGYLLRNLNGTYDDSHFCFENCESRNKFFDSNISKNRYIVANHVTHIKTRGKDKGRAVHLKLNCPVIVVPFVDPGLDFIRGVYVIGSKPLLTRYYDQSMSERVSPNFLKHLEDETKLISCGWLNDMTFIKFFQYVINTNNPIPLDPIEFVRCIGQN